MNWAQAELSRDPSRMLQAELPLLLTLGLSWLFPRGSGFSCPPSWATLVWDVPPLQLEHRGTARRGITTTQVVFWSTSALCLLLLGYFFGRRLARKARGRWKKVGTSESSCRDGSCCKSYWLMRRLKEDPELMKRFRKHLSNCRTFALDTLQAREKGNKGKLGRGDGEHSRLQQGSQEGRTLQGSS
ncbi:uncharacterized protein LOC114068793 isoform X2 [Empidonax traillii]|uniref:uncharacterized protein LOC114068793 isoform X2 n=1 Tax=Empidonax traillii TaxID=164674 RepID=UPI000FFD3E96|nr:uncharacterized protein LOC114068793 isoform X2 [Empidonax traillii]